MRWKSECDQLRILNRSTLKSATHSLLFIMCSAIEDPDVFARCPLISLRFKIRAGRGCLTRRSKRLEATPTQSPPTTTCTPIYYWTNMVEGQNIPTHRNKCSASLKNDSHSSRKITSIYIYIYIYIHTRVCIYICINCNYLFISSLSLSLSIYIYIYIS